MSYFIYKARDEKGKSVNGVMEAPTEEEALQKLRQQQYVPVNIKQTQHAKTKKVFKVKDLWKQFGRVKEQDIVLFNMKLASMISAGVTLLNALSILYTQITHPRLRSIMGQVQDDIRQGASFSEALQPHEQVFSQFYISLIKAAEASGTLPKILHRLAQYFDKRLALSQKIKSALFYPAILLGAGFLVVFMIVTFVFPKFVVVFEKAGVPLPAPTQIIYDASQHLGQFWWAYFLMIPIVMYVIRWLLHTPKGSWLWDSWMLEWPIFGKLNRDIMVVRYAQTLATLIESGVPMLKALDILQEVMGNQVFRQVVKDVRVSVKQGERVSEPMVISGEFPEDVTHMVAIGEETGKLDYMLYQVAAYYEQSIDYSVKQLTTLIEPILISFLAVMVGFIMAAMLLPLFDMVKTI